jgi:hypothetical protein
VSPRWIYIPSGWSFTNTYSASLDGSAEYIDFGNILNDNFCKGAMTVSAWIKLSSLPAVVGTICAKYQTNVKGNSFSVLSDGTFFLSIDLGLLYKFSTAKISTNTWTHVTATYDGSGRSSGINIYKNAVLTNGAEDDNGSTDESNTASFTIGRLDATNGFYFPGLIGDLLITNFACTSTEVTELYNEGSELDITSFSRYADINGDTGCLWVNWEADDLTATTGSVTDLLNSRTGTPVNTENTDKVSDSP